MCSRKWPDGHTRQIEEYKNIVKHNRCGTCLKDLTGEVLRVKTFNEDQVIEFIVEGIKEGKKTNHCHYHEFKKMANRIIRRQKI